MQVVFSERWRFFGTRKWRFVNTLIVPKIMLRHVTLRNLTWSNVILVDLTGVSQNNLSLLT